MQWLVITFRRHGWVAACVEALFAQFSPAVTAASRVAGRAAGASSGDGPGV
jgi:hypothetical protein